MKRLLLICIAIFAMQTLSAQMITSARVIEIEDNSKKKAQEAEKKAQKEREQAEKKAKEEQKRAQEAEKKAQKEREQAEKKAKEEQKRAQETEKKVQKEREQAEREKRELAQKETKQKKILSPKVKSVRGYGQFVQYSYGYNQYLGSSMGLNYIGGYRFNANLFLGIGAGVQYALDNVTLPSSMSESDPMTCLPTTDWNIPVFGYFRIDFSKKSWTPFVALSAGMRLVTEKKYLDRIGDNGKWHKSNGFIGEVILGIDKRLSNKLSLYLGVGYKLENVAFGNYACKGNWLEYHWAHGMDITIGLKF